MAGHGERTHIRGNEAGASPESLAENLHLGAPLG
jgi:hypothetical protein